MLYHISSIPINNTEACSTILNDTYKLVSPRVKRRKNIKYKMQHFKQLCRRNAIIMQAIFCFSLISLSPLLNLPNLAGFCCMYNLKPSAVWAFAFQKKINPKIGVGLLPIYKVFGCSALPSQISNYI